MLDISHANTIVRITFFFYSSNKRFTFPLAQHWVNRVARYTYKASQSYFQVSIWITAANLSRLSYSNTWQANKQDKKTQNTSCCTYPSCWPYHSETTCWMKDRVPSHKLQPQRDPASIFILTKRNTLHFRDASLSPHTSRRPRVTIESASNLPSIATIISSYNTHLSPEHKRLPNQQLIDQAKHVSLKLFPVSYSMLKQALDVELVSLHHFLWTITRQVTLQFFWRLFNLYWLISTSNAIGMLFFSAEI